ncbi:MAG: ABC transporter substrate binding protein [Candidatus Marithrix sp.]
MKIRRLFIIVFTIFFTACVSVKTPPIEEIITNKPVGNTYAFIKSRNLQQMNEVIIGFTESFPNARIVTLDIEGKKDARKVKNFIKTNNPAIIICLGSLAAGTTINIEKKIPIIFSMVINYKKYPELKQDNVTGISMEIPPISLFTQFKMLLPEINSIGVPFHPEASLEIIDDAVVNSTKMGIKLIKIAVTNPNTILDKLSDKSDSYAGLWMLADTKLYNRKTQAIYQLISFSKEQKKPLLVFSEAFLKPGAFFSISIDYNSLGSQTALISRQIVQDKIAPKNISVAPPIGTYTVINKEIAELLLANDLDESIYDEVDKIYGEDEEENE